LEKTDITLEGIHYATCRPIRLEISNGIIMSIQETGYVQKENGASGSAEDVPVIAPGLVDLQVNGYKGIDFNAPGLTADQIEKVSVELLGKGITGYFPTLITGPRERTLELLEVIANAVRKPGLAGKLIKGIHMEGPFISREDGPRGAHPAAYCLDPDPELIKKWNEASDGLVRLVTLAPELPGSEKVIRTCREAGIAVGIGHTSADSEVIRRAVEAGASLSTHLGNGAHNILPRHPNYIWDQLAEEALYASMIADGFHLPDAVLKVFIRVKGEKAILVSDSMSYSGMPPGVYDSPATGKVRLTTEGKLHRKGEPGTLAGSASILMDGIRKITTIQGLPFAWDMASVYPNRLLNDRVPAGLEPGAPADLVLLRSVEPEPEISKVYKGGKIYSA
jgi:N-acetylglucosamine-6-phosphate deacetylase